MLEALYQYAQNQSWTAKPGFKHKRIRHYILFSRDGKFLGFDTVEEGTAAPLCPDIGSLNQGNKCNIIVEKADIVLNLPKKEKDGTMLYQREEKHKFYLDALIEAAQHDALFQPAVQGLQAQIAEIADAYLAFPTNRAKQTDFLSIKVDGKPLESSNGYLAWWEEFRRRCEKEKQEKKKKRTAKDAVRCLITGALTEPARIVQPVSGLIVVNRRRQCDSLICFDKDAYQSYGFEQAANAAVSEEAVTDVNAALTKLLQEGSPSIASTKSIHWYQEPTELDVISLPDYGFGSDVDDEPEKSAAKTAEDKKAQDELRVKKLFRALMDKTLPVMPQNRYYMMSLSSAGGRIMIRQYEEGTYTELCNHIRAWFMDLVIDVPSYGKSYPKLFGVYSRLLKHTTDNKNLQERIDDELSSLSTQIRYAILHQTPLPDVVAAKALAYIRSDMVCTAEDDKQSSHAPDKVACQVLKAWLNRKYRQEKKEEFLIMETLNNESPSIAYQAGRLMAMYAAVQKAALRDVNAGVVERYYTSACTSPALVMGKLATMAQYHLSKLKGEKPGLCTIFQKQLEEISCAIGTSLPKTFSLEQQSEFALGYYFQNADNRAKKTQTKKTEE